MRSAILLRYVAVAGLLLLGAYGAVKLRAHLRTPEDTLDLSVVPNYNWKEDGYTSITLRDRRGKGITTPARFTLLYSFKTVKHESSGHYLIAVGLQTMQFPFYMVWSYTPTGGFQEALPDGPERMSGATLDELARGTFQQSSNVGREGSPDLPDEPITRVWTYDPKSRMFKPGEWVTGRLPWTPPPSEAD